ncbi:DUF1622 domain-containing protein [Devosia chinhatensis]|uniref:DUF1622 domain-containing protein n=1 Tax=Devosia chinhatensis TaxID=429727 RepID=A0A0F5FLV2_9HYPH|nr:DUF1622 domain-containing protein [Devosia chinhatensis]KKB09831.1 hypothetical protein VE26_08290 [Devosia chinhatensis]
MDSIFTANLLNVITRTIEWCGIAIIVGGLIYGSVRFALSVVLAKADEPRFRRYRADAGRGILLGLEFLVAADIIATVAIEPSLESLAVLAGIVAIRTFLSLSLEVEVSGRWPWQQPSTEVQQRQQSK